MSDKHWFEWFRWGVLTCVLLWTTPGIAQQSVNRSEQNSLSPQSADLVDESIRQLRAAVDGMRSDWQQSRAETSELRRALDEVRSGAAPRDAVLRNAVASSATTLSNVLPNNPPQDQQPGLQPEDRKSGERAATLEEEYQLLSGKVDDQYQTKVESASKYRLRVSGIVLMNLFSNQGVVDNIDFPMYAYARPAGDSGGSFGATLRQSELGFEAFGPTVAGAKTRADLQLDLAGGFPFVPNGVDSGLMRLRTATMRMDWTDTSVVVGQDAIFFSPTSPTSFASLAIPALSGAGNLWAWVPQIRVEHRVALGEQ